jgi:enterochelin esterase-like enzyme
MAAAPKSSQVGRCEVPPRLGGDAALAVSGQVGSVSFFRPTFYRLRTMSLQLTLSGIIIVLLFQAANVSAQQGQKKRASKQQRDVTTWVNKPEAAALPIGVSHHTYFSKSMGHDVGYCIYLPPGYSQSATLRYPVIYSLHGAGGDETRGLLAAEVLHEGIQLKRWPEMILVFPNGGKTTLYKDSYDGKSMAETTVVKELIPHIDATYRTIADRHGRCIEGFSMGGRGSTRLALKYPDLFCSLFNQAGNVYHVSELFDAPPNEDYRVYLGPDKQRYLDNDPYLLLSKNLDRIKGKLRIQIFCGTLDDGHLPSIRDFHAALLKAGVDHTYFEIEGLAHERTKMINQFRSIWFDYHVESLRLAAKSAAGN